MPTNRNNENSSNISASYPTWVGFIFIFNLIVGTGALTLPSVFAKAGWVFSLILIVLIAVVGFMTVSFIIEALACANAIKTWHYLNFETNSDENINDTTSLLPNNSEDETSLSDHHPLNVYYKLDHKFELGEMATLFFNEIGRISLYLCLVTYMYGDLSIYSAVIAKSLRDISCDKNSTLTLYNYKANNDSQLLCWQSHTMSRFDVYRIFLLCFTLLFGPLSAFSVQKTKFLQVITLILRWLAFIFMIAIAIKMIFKNENNAKPVPMNIYGVPSLFGACVYSFMCHHSIPSLIGPIRNKKKIFKLISWDYICICTFYIVLAVTGIFAFEHLEDIYTLNFIPTHNNDYSFSAELLKVIDYFLALFPVFTLTTSYPIIAITLKNNLEILFLDMTRYETYNYFLRRILFPLCAVVPPFFITFFTENVNSLVSFTGSYAGAGIQYIIPVFLVYFARITCTELLGSRIVNNYQSSFRSVYWLLFVLFWALLCITLVTINLFY